MIDAVSLARLKTVHPSLDALVCLLESDFEAHVPGDGLIVAQALRRWSDQEALWLEGRDGAGNVVDPAAVVTNAMPGYSWHEFGLAVDVVPRSLVNTPGWSRGHPLWSVITRLAMARGLAPGACWVHPDLPHLQLTGIFPVTPTDEVRRLFLTGGGINAVWAAAQIPAR